MEYFERKEMKYLLEVQQAESLIQRIQPYLQEDPYSPYWISSLYFDTAQFGLIGRCMDKPASREKVRLRSYGVCQESDPVFFEVKKKFRGITYKSRETFQWKEIRESLFCSDRIAFCQKELAKLFQRMKLIPQFQISYHRYAYVWKDNTDVRITFDTRIQARKSELHLESVQGTPILEDNQVLMEIKALHGLPFELSRQLSFLQIWPTSFSKASTAFMRKETLQ